MRQLDITIARLKLLLADIGAKKEALAATRHQYREQIERLIRFAVHEDGGVDRSLAMMMDVDGRLQNLARQEHYLDLIGGRAQRELESLQLTRLIEDTRAQLLMLRQQQQSTTGHGASEDLARITHEVRRLEEIITAASGAAAKSVTGGA